VRKRCFFAGVLSIAVIAHAALTSARCRFRKHNGAVKLGTHDEVGNLRAARARRLRRQAHACESAT
jgi:hypothetical protein